jgi:polyisoprenoid-binding protein YceI
VSFHVKYLGEELDQFGKKKFGFVAKTTIKRSEFNMNFNVAGATGKWIIGDDVPLKIYSEWIQQEGSKN